MADPSSQLQGARAPRKTPSHASIGRRSTLRQSQQSLANDLQEDQSEVPVNSSRFSLAHELAAAMMPDPGSSRAFADEFGIEFDEGAEDAEEQEEAANADTPTLAPVHETDPAADLVAAQQQQPLSAATDAFATSEPPKSRRSPPPVVFEQDPLLVLSQTVKSTDVFLNQLRRLDADAPTAPSHHEPPIERLAADIIRHINETTRARESQVRELLECEREFRKIGAALGGNDVLGDLDALPYVEGLVDDVENNQEAVDEESGGGAPRPLSRASWQDEPDPHSLDALEDEIEEGDIDDYDEPHSAKENLGIPPPPQLTGQPTPRSTIPHLTHMRNVNQSLVNTLVTISEQVQVNGAATADAGRKLRALRHRIEEWRAESESAEKSRIRVEKWEAGILDDGNEPALSTSTSSREQSPTPGTPPAATEGTPIPTGKRLDARKIVEAELKAFEKVLEEVDLKTKAIMASQG